jgi:methionyl-tRNA formyltransferase
MTLRLAFMGTPEFAARSLAEVAAAGHEIVRVYSQPPRRRGRGQSEQKTPVHQLADILGIPVETPKSFKAPEVIADFKALNLDVALVVAYGQILTQEALDAPRLGCLNLHGSLLPRWRGAAPIQRAIMAGDEMTGVQVMQMEAGLDTGPILLSETLAISDTDTASTLHDRMADIGALMWPRALGALERESLVAQPQSEDGATYAKKITPEEARIDWTRSATDLSCHIRGLSPFPGAWFELDNDKGPVRIKVLMATPEAGSAEPGTTLDDGLLVACGSGALRITRLQRQGKGPMDAADYLRGTPLPVGTRIA